MHKTDVLIIGGGPSGTVAASMVQQEGLKATIIERQKFPRFVIGESLLPRCMEPLSKAKLLDAVKAQNFQVKHGAKFYVGSKETEFNFAEQFTEGWDWTWQVTRADFDKALADEVEKRGVEILYEHTVTGISFDGTDSVTDVLAPDGSALQVAAKFVIDASGYGRVLPRLLGLEKKSPMAHRTSIFTHIKGKDHESVCDRTTIQVIVVDRDVWVWMIPLADGKTSIGFVGTEKYFDQFEGTSEDKFRKMMDSETLLRNRFEHYELVFPPKTISGFSSSVSQLHGPGFALTGNASEFLDPIFSSGVTFALESGCLAGQLAAQEVKTGSADWENNFESYILQGVDVFRTYVKAWYDGSLQHIFFSDQAAFNPLIRKQICSVLAGYVWDTQNPYVRKHGKALKALSRVIEMIEAR